MLSEKESKRVMFRFQRELGRFSHKLGADYRERAQATERARHVCEYIHSVAQTLAGCNERPVRVETVIEKDSQAKSDEFTVHLKLEGAGIGYLWKMPGNWIMHYSVSAKHTPFFRRALIQFGNLLVRKEAYRQLLFQRLEPARQLLQAEFGNWLQAGQLRVEEDFHAESGWRVDQDFCCLRFIRGDWEHTLRAYSNYYTWGIAFKDPSLTFRSQEDMLLHMRQELGALLSKLTSSG